MELNWPILFIVALVPLIVGSIWYNPKVFGKMWMRTSGVSEDKLSSGKMAVIYGLTYLFSLFIASTLMGMVIHQFGIFGVLEGSPGFGDEGSEVQKYFEDFINRFENNHRNFGHGVMHGGMAAVTFALPLIAINALFERRGWKYIWIHFGYWLISLMLMGGVICHFI